MSDRLQREIDELLSKLQDLPRRSLWARLRYRLGSGFRRLRQALASLRLPRLTVGRLLMLSIVILIVGYVFASSDDSLGRILILGGFGGLVLAIILSLRRSSRLPEKRWRGQPLELHGSPMSTRLRSWWVRWRGRR